MLQKYIFQIKKWTNVSEKEMRIYISIFLLQSVINVAEQECYLSKSIHTKII